MTSMQPLWWFALPVLLLPLWWHLQKRERTRTEPLATARFLPAAAPRQQRVPRLVELLLLLIRLLLLVVLLAWLAVLAMPWKRDTVFIASSLNDEPWTVQQIHAAGMDGAAREPLPADVWTWLARNEHAWHPSARLLIVARDLPMPALPPRLAHTITLRTSAPAAAQRASAAPAPHERHVVVATAPQRLPRWQALFAAFSTAGEGANRYIIADTPTSTTELIVWDRPETQPPSSWQAPLWWRTTAAPASGPASGPASTFQPFIAQPALFTSAPSQQGLIWSAAQWPLTDAPAARALYEHWQRQSRSWPAYALPASIQTLPAQRKSPLPATIANSPEWLAIALLALFTIERILAHVRRR